MLYAIVDQDGQPLTDQATGEPYVFRTRDEARQFVMPGERVAALLEGGKKIVPLTR